MSTSKTFSDMIRTLSFVMTVFIVMFHASHCEETRWYRELTSDFRIGGVLFFFFISGFFLANRRYNYVTIKEWWANAIKKRFRTLLLPYFLWCIVGYRGGNVLDAFGLTGVLPTANAPLWYVKFLFLFCLFSPLLVVMSDRMSRFVHPAFVAICCLLAIPWLEIPLKFSLWVSLFAFWCGICFAGKELPLLSIGISGRVWLIVSWISIFAFRLFLNEAGNAYLWPMRVYGGLLFIGVVYCMVATFDIHVYESLHCNFFVYCMHSIVLVGFHPFPSSFFLGSMANAVITICLCIVVAALLRRFSSALYALLTGGR